MLRNRSSVQLRKHDEGHLEPAPKGLQSSIHGWAWGFHRVTRAHKWQILALPSIPSTVQWFWPESISVRCGMWGHLSSGVTQENSQKKRNKNKTIQGQLQKLPKMFLTWSESSVTRSPSFVIPSSFRSFRWGQRARQNALATCSVSLLWSAGSLRQLCWSSFSRKNTYPQTKEAFTLCWGCGTSRLAPVFEHPVL